MRRSVFDASSLISPFGKIQRLIAACSSRKSARPAQRAASKGNFAASSRTCCRSHDEVSSSDPASKKSAASSTAPGASSRSSDPTGSASAPKPNSRSARSHSRASRINANAPSSAARSCPGSNPAINLLPGAHVVLSRNNSRSLSNSNTSCVVRDIRLRAVSSKYGNCIISRRFSNFYFLPSLFLIHFLKFLQKIPRHIFRRPRRMHQIPLRLAPLRRLCRRPRSLLHFPHPPQYRRPEISQDNNRLRRHHALVQHFPHHCQLHQRSRSTLARHKSIRKPYQFKQPFFPRLDPHFHVDPLIRLARKKFRRDAIYL